MSYIELHACSAFSCLRGGSFPEQLAEVAAELEMPAIALLDRNGVYGAQRFSVAAREHGVRPIIGAELSMEDGSILPVLGENRTGYKNLCGLLTQAHLRSEKGKCTVQWDELPQFTEGLLAFFGSGSAGILGRGERGPPPRHVRHVAGQQRTNGRKARQSNTQRPPATCRRQRAKCSRSPEFRGPAKIVNQH